MAVSDSTARKIIGYLKENLADGLGERLYFDALAFRSEKVPMLVVTPCPTIPEVRRGGAVDVNTRNMICFVSLFWSAEEKGRNYDEFEAASAAIADAMAGMQGTSTLGSDVLKSEVSPEDTSISYDSETTRYTAELQVNIQFVR